MKNLNIFQKLMFVINTIFCIVLIIGYFLPYIAPTKSAVLSVLSLTMPIMIVLNILFIFYWILKLKKQFLLSTLVGLIGFFIAPQFVKFNSINEQSNDEISVMNYNVRLFNKYQWIKDETTSNKIKSFIEKESPDILCIQEFHPLGEKLLNYPYKYIQTAQKNKYFGQAIFSKYKIVNKGSLGFKNTSNNAIFIDVVKKRDTIRIYNLHLESLGLHPDKENFGQDNSEKLLKRLGNEFIKQQKQVEQLLAHKNNTNLPALIVGDFNNTSYSWVYNQLTTKMNDTFIEAGNGFGTTFKVKNIPLRIDYILADKVFRINQHKNYHIKLSDHEPIFARIGLE
jgi:endonuclease/exonuclease/phosphatase family metal-dependent hydrolase